LIFCQPDGCCCAENFAEIKFLGVITD
jgi:hypothetical protein